MLLHGKPGTAKCRDPQEVKMNKKELIAALADKTGSTRADADRNIAALIEVISSTLGKGDKITLSGFGIFEVRERAARIGRNPRNGKSLQINAEKVPAFRAGTTLKATLNGGMK
jgi:DNA-binding protein HU-beta